MKIAIHQPNFLPWMGYFYKMSQCDTFVLLDHVEFTKKSFTKRVTIHDPTDIQKDKFLIVPTKKHSDFSAINEIKLSDNNIWHNKLKSQIHQTYNKAPFYYQISPIIDSFLTEPRSSDSFSEYTIDIIKTIAEMLDIKPEWIISSQLDLDKRAMDINLKIILHLAGDQYISGMGAKKYQDENIFETNQIALRYSDFPAKFNLLPVKTHFLNKSILSYLAYYEIGEIQKWLSAKNIH